MEKKKVEAEIYKATYWNKDHEKSIREQWREIPKYPRVVALYILACGNCRELIWGEMEVKESNDEEVPIPHFFDHSGDDRREITICLNCKEELYLQKDGLNIVLEGGKVRVDPMPSGVKGCLFQSPRSLQSEFNNNYLRFSGKRPS